MTYYGQCMVTGISLDRFSHVWIPKEIRSRLITVRVYPFEISIHLDPHPNRFMFFLLFGSWLVSLRQYSPSKISLVLPPPPRAHLRGQTQDNWHLRCGQGGRWGVQTLPWGPFLALVGSDLKIDVNPFQIPKTRKTNMGREVSPLKIFNF